MNSESHDPRDIPVLTEAIDHETSLDPKLVAAAITTGALELADSLLHQAARDIEAALFERVFELRTPGTRRTELAWDAAVSKIDRQPQGIMDKAFSPRHRVAHLRALGSRRLLRAERRAGAIRSSFRRRT
jgi:hypothetical protein